MAVFKPIKADESKLNLINTTDGNCIFVINGNNGIYIDTLNEGRILVADKTPDIDNSIIDDENDEIKANNLVTRSAVKEIINEIDNNNNNNLALSHWESEKEYVLGNLVIYENSIYECAEAHESGIEFDTTKWTLLTGSKGDKGDPGEDGVSPVINTLSLDTGVEITITDVNGTQNFNIFNGINGFSPVISYETTDVGTTVIMTDINDTHTFDLYNGQNGASAYDIAVDNGFEGTEQEWIETLNGENGITPYINSETKHWMIGETDTGVLAEAHIILSDEDGELFVTKTEFNELYDMISSANSLLENTLNGV